jgi:hypothetical protein
MDVAKKRIIKYYTKRSGPFKVYGDTYRATIVNDPEDKFFMCCGLRTIHIFDGLKDMPPTMQYNMAALLTKDDKPRLNIEALWNENVLGTLLIHAMPEDGWMGVGFKITEFVYAVDVPSAEVLGITRRYHGIDTREQSKEESKADTGTP